MLLELSECGKETSSQGELTEPAVCLYLVLSLSCLCSVHSTVQDVSFFTTESDATSMGPLRSHRDGGARVDAG